MLAVIGGPVADGEQIAEYRVAEVKETNKVSHAHTNESRETLVLSGDNWGSIDDLGETLRHMGDEEVDGSEVKDNPSGILKELKLELVKILKVGNLARGVVAVAVEWVHPFDSEVILWCVLDESELGQVNNQEN